jgi:hypothetical protein
VYHVPQEVLLQFVAAMPPASMQHESFRRACKEDKDIKKVRLYRCRLSLETALALLVAFNIALAVLCVAFMARKISPDVFVWFASLFHRPRRPSIVVGFHDVVPV